MKNLELKYKSVTAFAPATVANVGCGFDTMGFALENIGDHVTVSILSSSEKSFVEMTGLYGHLIPNEFDMNTASVAIKYFLNSLDKQDSKFKISVEKNLPLGSGMGSSASSAAAAVFAINHLFGNPYTTLELLPFAMEGERIACGAAHADNVAPSLLGGFILVQSYEPLQIISVPIHLDLYCVVVHPHIVLKTEDARNILPKEISVKKAIAQSANAGALIASLFLKDASILSRSMIDEIAEPYRISLIPNFENIKNLVLKNGGMNCNISGSGPSIFSICSSHELAVKVGETMQVGFKQVDLKCDVFISKFNAQGATILSTN